MFIIFKKKQLFSIILLILLFLLLFLLRTAHPATTKEVSSTSLLAYSEEIAKQNSVVTKELRDEIRNIYKNKKKIAYLTFDDGPTQKVTPKVLDILDTLNIKANFFVVGKHVVEHPELVKREYTSGHFIANHGYSHNNNKLYLSKNDFLNEVIRTDLVISEAIGKNYKSHLFRFPNGSISKNHHQDKLNAIEYLKEIDYTYIDWNCLNNDSVKKYSNTQLLDNLKNTSKNKNVLVILMHDTGDVNNTYDILEDSIHYLKQEGYEFHTFYDFFQN